VRLLFFNGRFWAIEALTGFCGEVMSLVQFSLGFARFVMHLPTVGLRGVG
jgi:hypothetical protein